MALLLPALSTCKKDHASRVKYEVRCPSGCNVAYFSGRMVFENGVSGTWSVTQWVDHGENYFLSATKTSVLGSVSATVYIDRESVANQETNLPYGTVVVEGPVPFP